MKLYNGDCRGILKLLPENSIHSIVTDPPYELGFMGKAWDKSGIAYDPTVWREVFRVLKPGGYLLSFGGSRTYHRMAVAIEDAGFEIRDMVEWVYGSGFPKSLNIGKAVDKIQGNERKDVGYNDNSRTHTPNHDVYEAGIRGKESRLTKGTSAWEGWGTALKPAHEPICMARKPLAENTVAENVLKHGTGGINIDGSRVGTEDSLIGGQYSGKERQDGVVYGRHKNLNPNQYQQPSGRFPANLIHDGSEEVVGMFPQQKSPKTYIRSTAAKGSNIDWNPKESNTDQSGYGDSGSASRFFYCAKSSKEQRNRGLDGICTVKYTHTVCEENTVAVQLLKKVISDMGQLSFSIGESGESIMVLSPLVSLSTTLTTIKQTTVLKTLSLLMHLLTNDYTEDVNSEVVNGGSLVENVENLKTWILTITNGKTELARGANNVALQMLSLISEEENWKPLTNFHSTVKPVSLMKYLIGLVTPPNGIVLDPFMGSGSTGIAAKVEGFDFVGIELDAEYYTIAKKRIASWEQEPKQMTIPT